MFFLIFTKFSELDFTTHPACVFFSGWLFADWTCAVIDALIDACGISSSSSDNKHWPTESLLLCYGLCARTTTSRCEISYEALLMYQNKHKILKTVVLIVRYYSSRVNHFQHLCRLTRPGCNTLHLFNEASTQEQEAWKCDILLHWEGVSFSKSWMQ